jgi:hypothetical protein
MLSASN